MSIKVKDLFGKEINRNIKGVIKVGQCDQENIKQELEEYVVTGELNKHLDEFFKAYSKSILSDTDKNGVWISGFFGSGKSHFLKILSYLLSNKTIENKSAVDYFYSKELQDSTLNNMELVKSISTDIILFNIDSKSDSNSKFNKDAIVNVLNKVFNEMQGFCSSMPWIADIERQMTKDGVYEEFKNKFQQISNKSWTEAREDFYYEEDTIIEALSKTTKMSKEAARNWYSKCEENYSLSIDKFASRVKEYCDLRGESHHIVFLIDEIGQYIGEDTQFMLNLQTVVEDLGNKCEGRCWVIVTAQEDLNEFTKTKGNDFSKIQGRFNTRLSLSSANVDEVIKKRILRKTPDADSELKNLYDEKKSVIKNILTFTTDFIGMKFYRNSDDFVEVYPFVPYQFNLLQAVFNGVREHGVAGRSLSKGERSLLGAYQQVAVEYMNERIGILVPFSAFYSTVESSLDSSVRSVINSAEDNERLNAFDVKVLKLLFLIKYVKEIKSNIENLATLLVDNIAASKKDIKKRLQESLNKLIVETLVEKNGDEYVFLTIHEQEINKEIKNMQIDSGEITQRIRDIIFDDIYEESKFTYSKRYKFSFNKIIDDMGKGPQSSSIGVKLITANYNLAEDARKSELKQLSDVESNVIVDISKNDSYLEEIENMLRIDAYLRIKKSRKSTAIIEAIEVKKSREREDRLKRVKFLIEEALKESDIYVSGALLNIKHQSGVSRINEGLRVLVDSTYNKLNYINEFIDNSKELHKLVNSYDNQQRGEEDTEANSLAVDEVNNYIKASCERNLQITMKHILAKFSNPPYGWKVMDIKGVVVSLFKRQYIKAFYDNRRLFTDKDILECVMDKSYEDKLILKSKKNINIKYIQVAKELIKDLFGISTISGNEDEIMKQFKELGKEELNIIEHIIMNYDYNVSYPGKKAVQLGKQLFKDMLNVEDTIEFFKYLYDLEEEFLDYVDHIDNVKDFFYKKENNEIDLNTSGEQLMSFNDAIKIISAYEENREFIDNAHIENIIKELQSIIGMREPYSKIPQISILIESYNDTILDMLKKERIPVLEFIKSCSEEVIEILKEYDFSNKFIDEIHRDFKGLTNKTEQSSSFAVILATVDLAEKLKLKWISEIAKEAGIENTTKLLSVRELVKDQRVIKSEEDINLIVEELKKKLIEELKGETIISLV
ncbi:BREX system P-loop protein BrxC [Clostridium sp. UBA1056]|uniref:BREX system P-loop protein BrxC n=1 Tax=unclassified Clostridium TaxID=2614128 RepID=UPI003217EA39